MKKLLIALIFVIGEFCSNGQTTVQGTIVNEGTNAITIFGKANTNLTGVIFDNIVVCVSIPDQSPAPTPTATIVTNNIPNFTWEVPSGYPHTANGRTYYAFNGTDNNNGQQSTWLANTENPIISIQFSGGAASAIVYLEDRTGSGGGPGFDYWYVQIVELGDVTAYGNRFFGPGATNGPNSFVPTSMPVSLPIELLSFNAYPDVDFVELKWETTYEQDSDYFSVERSGDGRGFVEIGTVKAKGSSITVSNYHFKDYSPLVGVNYYRLRQVDVGGSYNYSPTVTIEMHKENLFFTIYPNPTSGHFTLNIQNAASHPFTARLIDLWGRIVWEADAGEGANEIAKDGSLPSGLYELHLLGGRQTWSWKVVIK